MQFTWLVFVSTLKEAHVGLRKQISKHSISETTECSESLNSSLVGNLPGIWRVRKMSPKFSEELLHDSPRIVITKTTKVKEKLGRRLCFIISL